MEVAEVGLARVVYDAAEQQAGHAGPGGPQRVEEVRVRVNHIGRFDGEFRTFAGHNLHRTWTLQRLDKGPWRILNAWSP